MRSLGDLGRALPLILLAGCGSSESNGNNRCDMNVSIAVYPQSPTAPVTLVAMGMLDDPSWDRTWTVTRAGGGAVPFTATDGMNGGVTVDVAADQAGTYHFELRATQLGRACTATDDVTVKAPGATAAAYKLRVTPPVASGLPRQERSLIIYSRTPIDHQMFTVAPGIDAKGALVGPNGPVAGTLRFLSDAGLDVLAAAGGDGEMDAVLLPDDQYTTVLVPAADLAPRALPKASGAALATAAATGIDGGGGALVFNVDAGAGAAGTVVDDQGNPIAAARVTLRAGEVPSTVGVSDGGGAFALRAAAGTADLAVQADGWPDVAAPSLAVHDGCSYAVAYTVARAAVTGKVVASDGTSGMGGARVTIRSAQAIAKVATVAVDGGAPVAVGGAVRLTVVTLGDGSLPPLALPPGEYDLLVQPPPSDPGDGATALHRSLAQAANWTLELAPRVAIAGTIKDGAGKPVGGVLVTAAESLVGVAHSAVSDGDGGFQVTGVDPAAAVDLFFDPPPARGLLRGHRALPAGATDGTITLPPGLLVGGVIAPQSGAPLAGARVEAFCDGCSDPWPAGAATSGPDGSFTLYLKDPG